jgi:carboxylesterase type B
VKFAEAKGAHSLADLRAMAWNDLFAPVAGLRFGPVVDGFVVPAAPSEVFAAGKQNDVPTLTGSNADENGASPKPAVTATQFKAQAQQRYGDAAAEFLKLYPVTSDADAPDRSNEAARDRQRVMYDEWAAVRAKTAKTPAFVYYYSHVLPGPDADKYGAFHTSEVPYALDSLAWSDRPFTGDDRKVADTLSSYWANFAATGDPNGKGLAHWPSTKEQPQMVMEIGDRNRAIPAAGSDVKYGFFRKALSIAPSAGPRIP